MNIGSKRWYVASYWQVAQIRACELACNAAAFIFQKINAESDENVIKDFAASVYVSCEDHSLRCQAQLMELGWIKE